MGFIFEENKGCLLKRWPRGASHHVQRPTFEKGSAWPEKTMARAFGRKYQSYTLSNSLWD